MEQLESTLGTQRELRQSIGDARSEVSAIPHLKPTLPPYSAAMPSHQATQGTSL